MGGCSALNCRNHPSRGFRCFSFPADPERRMLWRINCRRDDWIPGRSARICEVHFEKDQFEQRRMDGLKKLKPYAIPTIFDFSEPSKKRSRKKAVQSTIDIPPPVLFNSVRKRRRCDDQASIASSVNSNSDSTHNIRSSEFESEMCYEENVSDGDCHDDGLSVTSFMSASEYSSIPEEVQNIDGDDIQYLSVGDCKNSMTDSDSACLTRLTEDKSINNFIQDNEQEHCEQHAEELRQLRLENKNYKRRIEELENLRLENEQLKKKVEILNCFLKTLLPEEDIQAFEEANFD